MSSYSSENNDTRRVIDLSSNNIGSRLHESLVDSNRAIYTSGMQERSLNEQNIHLVNTLEERSPNDKLLLSPYEEELYRRSLRLSPVTSIAAPIPTVTLLGEDAPPEAGKTALPYMTDFDKFQVEQEKNNKNRRQGLEQNNDSLLSLFTKWPIYSSKKIKQKMNRHNSLKRTHSSVRRKDFSVQSEYAKYNKDKKFIFHKGFSQRHNSVNSLRRNYTKKTHFRKRSRFQNEQELMSYMRYINASQMDITEVITADNIRMYLYSKNSLRSLLRVNPTLHPIKVPLMQFNELLNKKKNSPQGSNVVKRPSISRNLLRKAKHVRRSNTLPANKTSFAERLNPELYRTWNSYLKAIIAKRVELRISCLLGEDMSSFASSVRNSAIVYRESITPPLELGSPGNPIVISDNEDAPPVRGSQDNSSNTDGYGTIEKLYHENDTDDLSTRPSTSIFSVRQSLTSADQNRRSFFFPPDNPGMHKIDEERSIRSVTSRNTLS